MSDRYQSRAILTPDGELKLADPGRLREYAQRGYAGTVVVMIRRPINRRTLDQNALYWGPVISAVMNASGQYDTPEETHEYLKRKYRIKSTSAMSKHAMAAYISQIIADGDQGDFGPDWFWSDEEAEGEIAA